MTQFIKPFRSFVFIVCTIASLTCVSCGQNDSKLDDTDISPTGAAPTSSSSTDSSSSTIDTTNTADTGTMNGTNK